MNVSQVAPLSFSQESKVSGLQVAAAPAYRWLPAAGCPLVLAGCRLEGARGGPPLLVGPLGGAAAALRLWCLHVLPHPDASHLPCLPQKLIEQIGMLDRGQDPFAAPAPGGQQAQQAGGYGGGYGAAPQQQQQGGGYGGAGYGGAGGAQGGYGGGGGPQGGYGGGGGALGGAPLLMVGGGGAAGAGGDFKTPPNRGQGQGGYGGAPGGYPQNQNNNQNQWGQQQGGGGYGGGGAGAPGYNANPANFY